MKFKVGQVWEDREGCRWLILKAMSHYFEAYCPERTSSSARAFRVEDDGKHPTNDGCDLISLVTTYEDLDSVLRG